MMKNPERRPSVNDIVRTEFVILHISRLLSHTIRMGKGGAESAVRRDGVLGREGGVGLDEVDRNIEREKQRKVSCAKEGREKKEQVNEFIPVIILYFVIISFFNL